MGRDHLDVVLIEGDELEFVRARTHSDRFPDRRALVEISDRIRDPQVRRRTESLPPRARHCSRPDVLPDRRRWAAACGNGNHLTPTLMLTLQRIGPLMPSLLPSLASVPCLGR